MDKNSGELAHIRSSNFELLRIILMFAIIAHHYVENSNLQQLYDFSNINGNMIFLQLFGMFGKTAINGFTLITGYFMVKSKVNLKKFVKTYFEVKFYYIGFYLLFILIGYENFSVKSLIKTLFSVVYEAGKLYTGTYIIFFLFIPFINILVKNMNRRQYQYLLVLLLLYFTVFSTFMKHETFNFLGWMLTTYLIGGYISLYPCKYFLSVKIGILGLIVSILLMIISVLVVDFIGVRFGFESYYYMFSDSNKFLAIVCAIFMFLLFKNINIKQNRFINTVAASTFGILLIHTNSSTMRRFLWVDLFRNHEFYSESILIVHAILVVLIVYISCFLIDYLRIRFIEKPFFNYFKFFDYLDRR